MKLQRKLVLETYKAGINIKAGTMSGFYKFICKKGIAYLICPLTTPLAYKVECAFTYNASLFKEL